MFNLPIHRAERRRVRNNPNGLHGGVYGPRDFARGLVDAHRTASSAGQTIQEQWTARCPQSQCAHRHSVCTTHRNSVGVSAAGDGLRVWNDLLAPLGQVARVGRMAARVRGVAGATAQGRPARLVKMRRRLVQRARRFWGEQTGPNPTDRRKLGCKHHIVTDGQGIPLAFTVTGANRHDVTQLVALIDAIPPVRGKAGRPKRRPRYVVADRAYHSAPHEAELSERGIGAFIARRNSSHGSGLGILRWVVERTISWLHQFRRLRVRYERRVDIHKAFLALGCICICFNYLNDFC